MTSFQQLTQNLTGFSQPVATRRSAVLQLADIGGDQAFPYLIDALTDIAPGVRREAANALLQYDDPAATPALLNAIKVEDNDLTRWTLIEVLGNIGTTSAIPELKELLSITLSPLTKREFQKSIDLITARHQDIESAEISEPTPDNSDSVEFIQPQDQSESPQDFDNVVEVEDYADDTPTEPEDSSDGTEHSHIDEENSDPEDIDVTTIDLDGEQVQQSDESAETEAAPDEPDSNTAGKMDSFEDSDEVRGPLKILGSSRTLPVLVPNTSVVLYEEEERAYKPSTLAMVLQPNAYLSKQWISRTRLYVVLFCLLVGAAAALIYSQVQRRPRSPYILKPEIAYMEQPEKYLSAGMFFIQEGDYRSAIETLEFIRGVDTINPNLSDLYKYLGFVYFEENHYARAVESYEYFLQTHKNRTSQPFVAEASYSLSGLTDNVDYKIYNSLGKAYACLGYLNKAKNAYETAIEIAPNEPEAYSNLAQLYSDGYQQKYLFTEALAYAAVRLNPDDASYHDTLGWIMAKSGRLNKATHTLEQAIRLQKDYVPAHYHLSEVAQKSRSPEQGFNVVQKDLINKIRPTKTRSEMLDVLSYIYQTNAQKISRFTASLLKQRGIER